MKTYLAIIFKTSKVLTDGSSTVYIRVTINRKQKYFSTGVRVLPKNWNEKTNKVLYKDYEYIYKNNLIENCYNRAKEIVLKYS